MTPSVAAPGDTDPSDATGNTELIHLFTRNFGKGVISNFVVRKNDTFFSCKSVTMRGFVSELMKQLS